MLTVDEKGNIIKKAQVEKINSNDTTPAAAVNFPINTQYSNELGRNPINFLRQDRHRRGIQVYTTSQILRTTGRDKNGLLLSWGTEQPYFFLTADQRNQMFRLSSIIFGIVSSRMNRISSIDFDIVPLHKRIEEMAEKFKDMKDLYSEFKTSLDYRDVAMKASIVRRLKQYMKDMKPDLSNFNSSLLRWKRGLQRNVEYSSDEIKEWVLQPNQGVSWESYVKKVVFNLNIHGADATYKQCQDGRLENFDSLPGGTVFKLKSPYFSALSGFIQVIPGFEPQVFFDDEISYSEYLTTSCQSQSMIPLEALINVISEHLLFDGRMAEVADGTLPPEKMVIIADNSPFGNPDTDHEFDMPINPEEQRRIEERINEPRKNAIMTFSGNTVEVVDLSRENTWDFQNARKKDIREECALVFNMSNIEVNLTGSGDTSGRQTAEVQQEIEQGKGTGPILKNIANSMMHNIIPNRFGPGWKFEFSATKNELEERDLDYKKLLNGELTINELRESYSKPIFPEDQYNRPMNQPNQQQPGASTAQPMFTKALQ